MSKFHPQLIILILLYSIMCFSKEVLNYENNRKFEKNKIHLSTSKLFEIQLDGNEKVPFIRMNRFFVADENSNFYLTCTDSSTINVFDNKGNFVNKFCRRGFGPGEADKISFTAVVSDKFYLYDYLQKKILRYNLKNYEFIDDIVVTNLNYFTELNSNKLLSVFRNDYNNSIEFWITDYDFNKLNLFYEETVYSEVTGVKNNITYAKSKSAEPMWSIDKQRKLIYIPLQDKIDKYVIKCFDFEGKLVSVISKQYYKTRFNNEETEFRNNDIFAQFLPPRNYKYSFKNVHLDKYGNLLVRSTAFRNKNNRNDFYLDLFKNGKFTGRILFDLIKTNNENAEQRLYLKNDRLYIYDRDNAILSVYDYSIGDLNE